MTRALKDLIGIATEPQSVEVERGHIRRFAKAVGETNALHLDAAAAQAAGFRDIVAPPSFLLALYDMEAYYEAFGINPQTVMHAEEEYEYFRDICAGDTLTLTHTVVDAYDTKAPHGMLTFVVVETRAADLDSKQVCKGRRVMVDLRV